MQKLQITIFLTIILHFAIVVVITQSSSTAEKEKKQVSISDIPAQITLIPTQPPTTLNTPETEKNNQQQIVNQQELEAYKTASATATISTTKGDIILELFGEEAPYTVANFIKKAKNGFYKNLTFHRVEDWVIQGGDPKGDGTGGGEMKTELNSKPFVRGSLGVARGSNIEISNDSQFFITKTDASHLNGQYTNFGMVKEGLDVVDKIEIGDKILNITIQE